MEDSDQTRLEELLTCPVCQDIFKDPVQLPCGHSLCVRCLENLVGHLLPDASFRCPDCRATFGETVRGQKSYALASIAEDFKLNKSWRETQTKCVYCDFCPEKNILAIKTCLKCEVSLCKQHVKDHLELMVFTGHPLVEPLSDLRERKCPQHDDEVLRYYCRSSRRYICNICALERKQLSRATDLSSVLWRQLTDNIDQHFKMLKEQISESFNAVNEPQRRTRRDNPADSHINGVTVVLLLLWFIVLYYAYNYSVENQTLRESLEKQQIIHDHHIYSTIVDRLADRPLKSSKPPETKDEGVKGSGDEQRLDLSDSPQTL